jgi:sulfur-oxidizing protein SoxX
MRPDMRTKIIGMSVAALAVAGCAAMMGPERSGEIREGARRDEGLVQGARARRSSTASTRTKCSACAASIPATRSCQGNRREDREGAARGDQVSGGQPPGDWKEGEKIAQSGVGKQFSDDPTRPAWCELLRLPPAFEGRASRSERSARASTTSGSFRGFTPDKEKYAYGKVYNSEAYSACSSMPRFGHAGILTEQQIKDVVALLMDPKSPVNQ